MKKNFFYLPVFLLILLTACGGGNKDKISTDVISNPRSASGDQNDALPVIEFEKEIHDFGKLIAGEKAVYSFKFTNTGNTDLLISQVKPSCGCTVPEFPRKAIKPGEGGVIKVTFDSSSRKGMQNKSIKVTTNCQPNYTHIRIKAQVISP